MADVPDSGDEKANGEMQRASIELSRDEALVFFDWISRFNSIEDAAFQDQAEQRVLWDIEAMLQRTLVEPFDASYAALLAASRDRVRDSEE